MSSQSAARPGQPGAQANPVWDRQAFDQLIEDVGEDAVEELLGVFSSDTEARGRADVVAQHCAGRQ